MIVTITLNPSIDKSVVVDAVIPDAKLRCSSVVEEAGGGGINVARALRRLGGDCLAICTAGGFNGQMLQNRLRSQDIAFRAIAVEAETRENLTVFDRGANKQYRFVLPYGNSTSISLEHIKTILEGLDSAPEFIVASGSLPASMPSNTYAKVAEIASQAGARFILDTSGAAMREALEQPIFMIKPNLAELGGLVGRNELEGDQVERAIREVVERYACQSVVVSLGPAGAYLFSDSQLKHIPAPIVKPRSTVGAGDSMVAGIVFGLSGGKTMEESLRLGVACGSAATLSPGSELFEKEVALRLYEGLSR
ncbi:MAG: phosphofructokinase [Spirochaetaceae bacterium]|nr:phosphofructokinase [Spirochaetaceae bacterium]|tara:strand:- start:9163 stop:10086 length:924 start_codon:yes stop_codon:yes gene_type:complete